MTMAYVIPNWQVASALLHYIHSLKRWKAMDMMIPGSPIPMLYQYPACFVEDKTPSTINTAPDYQKHANASYERC